MEKKRVIFIVFMVLLIAVVVFSRYNDVNYNPKDIGESNYGEPTVGEPTSSEPQIEIDMLDFLEISEGIYTHLYIRDLNENPEYIFTDYSIDIVDVQTGNIFSPKLSLQESFSFLNGAGYAELVWDSFSDLTDGNDYIIKINVNINNGNQYLYQYPFTATLSGSANDPFGEEERKVACNCVNQQLKLERPDGLIDDNLRIAKNLECPIRGSNDKNVGPGSSVSDLNNNYAHRWCFEYHAEVRPVTPGAKIDFNQCWEQQETKSTNYITYYAPPNDNSDIGNPADPVIETCPGYTSPTDDPGANGGTLNNPNLGIPRNPPGPSNNPNLDTTYPPGDPNRPLIDPNDPNSGQIPPRYPQIYCADSNDWRDDGYRNPGMNGKRWQKEHKPLPPDGMILHWVDSPQRVLHNNPISVEDPNNQGRMVTVFPKEMKTIWKGRARVSGVPNSCKCEWTLELITKLGIDGRRTSVEGKVLNKDCKIN
jgi:hypothetical protein